MLRKEATSYGEELLAEVLVAPPEKVPLYRSIMAYFKTWGFSPWSNGHFLNDREHFESLLQTAETIGQPVGLPQRLAKPVLYAFLIEDYNIRTLLMAQQGYDQSQFPRNGWWKFCQSKEGEKQSGIASQNQDQIAQDLAAKAGGLDPQKIKKELELRVGMSELHQLFRNFQRTTAFKETDWPSGSYTQENRVWRANNQTTSLVSILKTVSDEFYADIINEDFQEDLFYILDLLKLLGENDEFAKQYLTESGFDLQARIAEARFNRKEHNRQRLLEEKAALEAKKQEIDEELQEINTELEQSRPYIF